MNDVPLGVIAVQLDTTKGVVLLDRSNETPNPSYCVHGHVQCVICTQWCLLGHATLDAVKGGISPVCVPCARKHIKNDNQPIINLHDTMGEHE